MKELEAIHYRNVVVLKYPNIYNHPMHLNIHYFHFIWILIFSTFLCILIFTTFLWILIFKTFISILILTAILCILIIITSYCILIITILCILALSVRVYLMPHTQGDGDGRYGVYDTSFHGRRGLCSRVAINRLDQY